MTKSAASLTVVHQPEDFFRGLLVDACRSQQVKVFPETEVYLVKLLSQFMFTESLYVRDSEGNVKDEPLALKLKEAVETNQSEMQRLLFRHLGDFSLYTAGFFQESLSKKLVDVDYYVDIGGLAYRRVAASTPEDSLKQLYCELAEKFPNIVEVFGQVRDSAGSRTEVDLLRLYETWMRTKSDRAKKALEEAGITPLDVTSKKSWQ